MSQSSHKWREVCQSGTDSHKTTTRAMFLPLGAVVHVLTKVSNETGLASASEALTFVPGATPSTFGLPDYLPYKEREDLLPSI